MSFRYKYLKWPLILLFGIVLGPSLLIADNDIDIRILNNSDVNIYKKVFELQSKQIKSKNFKYGKIERLKKELITKYLLEQLMLINIYIQQDGEVIKN